MARGLLLLISMCLSLSGCGAGAWVEPTGAFAAANAAAIPEPPPYCTRSLGVVDCWADPDTLPNRPPQVADGPAGLTPAQEANRTRGWPGL